jgi:hypothetical protein
MLPPLLTIVIILSAFTLNEIQVGKSDSEKLDGRLAVIGIWQSVLTNTQIEGLTSALSAWKDLGPTALWAFNQASTTTPVTDLTGGGADQTAITGTTAVTGDDPPGFDFTLGITGTLAITLPALTMDLDGAGEATGVLAATLPPLTADLDGNAAATGALGVTLPAVAASFAGAASAEGVLAATLPSLTSDMNERSGPPPAVRVTNVVENRLATVTAVT